MKKKIFLILILLMVGKLFASPNIHYNPKIKNAKNFQFDITIEEVKITEKKL